MGLSENQTAFAEQQAQCTMLVWVLFFARSFRWNARALDTLGFGCLETWLFFLWTWYWERPGRANPLTLHMKQHLNIYTFFHLPRANRPFDLGETPAVWSTFCLLVPKDYFQALVLGLAELDSRRLMVFGSFGSVLASMLSLGNIFPIFASCGLVVEIQIPSELLIVIFICSPSNVSQVSRRGFPQKSRPKNSESTGQRMEAPFLASSPPVRSPSKVNQRDFPSEGTNLSRMDLRLGMANPLVRRRFQ